MELLLSPLASYFPTFPLKEKTFPTNSGQEGSSLHHHVLSLSIFYVAACYAFRRNKPTRRQTNHLRLATRLTLSFTL